MPDNQKERPPSLTITFNPATLQPTAIYPSGDLTTTLNAKLQAKADRILEALTEE